MTQAGALLTRFLLDTNFLAIPGKFKLDIYEQLGNFGKDQLYTIDLVVKELERMAIGAGKDARHARVAILMMKKSGVKVLHSESEGEHTDIVLRRFAKKVYYTVCTLDRALIKQLRDEKVPVISMRQGRYLERVN